MISDFSQFRKIDAHSHIGKFGSPFDVNFDTAMLAAQMKEYDIEKTILCPAAASLNAELLDAWRQMPDRIIPLFWINANLGDPAYAELEHYLRDLGFAGVKMQPLFDGFTADSPMVDPVMEIARKYRKPVFIHCGHPPFSLPWQIGWLVERHPNVPVVMLHMGHAHGVYVDAALKTAKRYPNVYLDTSGSPMSIKIREAYDTVGSDRVLFGIDSPFHEPSVEIEKIRATHLPEDALRRIYHDNAAKLLGL